LKIGFGSEPTDLSLEGVRRALEKARLGAVLDPEFVSLPKGPSGTHSVKGGKGIPTLPSCAWAPPVWFGPDGE